MPDAGEDATRGLILFDPLENKRLQRGGTAVVMRAHERGKPFKLRVLTSEVTFS